MMGKAHYYRAGFCGQPIEDTEPFNPEKWRTTNASPVFARRELVEA
jgi:hypothetical protein